MPENIELPGASHNKTNQVERAVDTPADFTSPEELYKDLITAIKNTIHLQICQISRRHTRPQERHMRDSSENRVSLI